MRVLFRVAVVILWGSLVSLGQARDTGAKQLVVSQRVVLPDVPPDLAVLIATCDSAGNTYAPVINEDLTIGTVVRISGDGKEVSRLSLESVEGFEEADMLTFALGADSRAHLLVRQLAPAPDGSQPNEPPATDLFILSFAPEIKLVAQTPLDFKGKPRQLAALPNGNFVVAGKTARDESHPNGLPFVGVFDSHGQLLKEVVLSGDNQPSELSVRIPGREPKTMQLRDLAYDLTIEFSNAGVSEDGTIFLARQSRQGPIFMISPTTEDVAGAIQFTPPKGTVLFSLKPSGRYVVAKFVRLELIRPREFESVEVHYLVLDPQTGEAIAHYIPSPELMKAWFVCSFGQDFLFLHALAEPGKVVLMKATPH